MAHRGPDASGVVTFANSVVGACRLAILGLEPESNQPLRSPDSPCVIVFNGEIYNYLELRNELKSLGHTFKSTGDTEVVLHAYEEWGGGSLTHFDGMFAFAIVDERSKTVFIARDRFGVKPLYYANTGDELLFSSDVRAILATGKVEPDVDEDTTVDYLRFGITDSSERTFFREIRQLLPGHSLTVTAGKMELKEWYDVRKHLAPAGSTVEHFQTDSFRKLFGESVRIRLRSDVPVGLLLSGGIDSSAVTSAAMEVGRRGSIQCFSVSFPNSSVDESAFAKEAAQHVGAPLHIEPANSFDAARVRACVRDQAEPFISPSVTAQWLLMEAVHRTGIRVVLSGQGADEYLCGYEYFDAYALQDMIRRGLWREALDHLVLQPSRRKLLRIILEFSFLSLPAPVRSLAWQKSWIRNTGHGITECEYWHALSSVRSLREAQLMHLKWRLPQLLRYEDRNSMAFSIETRQPFLDYRLVENVLALDGLALVSGGLRKRLLRQSMDGVVSSLVLNRRDKIGFQTPGSWVRSAEFQTELATLLERTPEPLRRILSLTKIRRMVKSVGRGTKEKDLWRIYNLLLWYREVVEQYGQGSGEAGRTTRPRESR